MSDVQTDRDRERSSGKTPPSVGQTLAEAARDLAARGIDNARLEAEVLLARALGTERVTFYAHPRQSLTPEQRSLYWKLVERRRGGEPLAYVIGEKEFFSLPFWVDRSVLIPRPETEGVVEAALEALRGTGARGRAPAFFDVGTGSGAIAVAILANLPEGRGIATDVSPAALDVARRNAARHGVADRLTLIAGDLFGGFEGEVDVVTCNPPYVGENDRACLAPDVRDWEPPEALFAGRDGVSFIRRLIQEAPAHLPSGGRLVFEIGIGQHDAVGGLLACDERWTDVEIRNDLAGIPRVVIARKR